MSFPNQNTQNLLDARMMERCIELAKLAFENGSTPVGCVITHADAIIAEGIESLPMSNDITGHAELIAIRTAVGQSGSRLLQNTTLYTTAEPCFMCSYAIRNSEISRVVYCLDTPLIGGVTSKHSILIDESLNQWKPAPKVVSGFRASEFLNHKDSWKTTCR